MQWVTKQPWYQQVAETQQQYDIRAGMLHDLVPEWVAAIETALHGIRRELDAWPATWEHRCYSRMTSVLEPLRCSCGSMPNLLVPALIECDLEDSFEQAFPRRWKLANGDTIEIRWSRGHSLAATIPDIITPESP